MDINPPQPTSTHFNSICSFYFVIMLMSSQIEKTKSGLRWVRWAAATARSGGRSPWPLDRMARGRDRPLGQAPGMSGRLDGRARNSSDPADAPVAAWNGTRQAVRLIGRQLGDFTFRPIGSPSTRADGRNAVGFLGRDQRIGRRHL